MKEFLILSSFLISVCILGCNRAPQDTQSSRPSFGQALESSLSQSATEEKARTASRERQKQIQTRQQQLQQDRLKSYSGGAPQNQ